MKPVSLNVTAAVTARMILLEEGHCLREHVLYACRASKNTPSSGVEATSLLTLVQMIESGLGIGLVPGMAVRAGLVASHSLVARPLVQPGPKRTIALLARRSTSRLADMKALAEVIREAACARP